MNTNLKKRVHAFVWIFLVAAAILTPVSAKAAAKVSKKAVTTSVSTLSKSTNVSRYQAMINGKEGIRSFQIFSQTNFGKSAYIASHGCAVSSLTTVLSGYTAKYADLIPSKTSKVLEKKVFGTRVWNANYRKSLGAQMPVSLYGISRILNYSSVPNKYVRYFKDKSAVTTIKNHLKNGNVAIIEVNNRTQKNGKFSSHYSFRWSSSKHTIVLLGITDTGKVIVADSANRSWSGQSQRIKFTTMEHLVKYMIPCSRTSTSCYYDGVSSSGGYILVNP